MRRFIGWALITVAFTYGIFVGLYLGFIGGIGLIFDGIRATPVDVFSTVFGLVLVIFAPLLIGFQTLFMIVAFGRQFHDWDQTDPYEAAQYVRGD